MTKIIYFFMFLSVSCWSQPEESSHIFSIDSLKKEYKLVRSNFSKTSLKKETSRLYRLLHKLKKTRESYKTPATKIYKTLDTLHAKTVVLLMRDGLYRIGKFDSVMYYKNYLQKQTTIPYYLAYSSELAASINASKGDYKGALESYEAAFKNYRKSKHPKSQIKIFNLTLFLTDFYARHSHIYHTEKTLELAGIELQKLKKHKKYSNQKFLYLTCKAGLLMDKGADKKALELLLSLDTEIAITRRDLAYYYIFLTQAFLNNKKTALAYQSYKSVYESEKFDKNFLVHLKDYKKIQLAEIYMQQKEFNKVGVLLDKLKTGSPYYGQLIRLLKSNYYYTTRYYKKAYTHLLAANKYQDSVNKENDKFAIDIANYKINREVRTIKLQALNDLKTLKITQYKIAIGIAIFVPLSLFFMLLYYFKQRRLAKELELKKQQELTQLKGAFLANVSHEIRTPITSIIGYISLLKEHTLDPKKGLYYANLTLKNSQKMISSLNRFLMLLKSEKGIKHNTNVASDKINFFFKEVITSFQADLKVKKIAFYYQSNILDSLSISYPFETLKTIITNLITNAIKYSNANTAIHFSINLTPSHLHISLKDQGFGIPENEKDKIFERFYQSENNDGIAGFGIGLSLVSELVKTLKGTLELESEINVGSVFYVSLPFIVENHALNTNTNELPEELLSIAIIEKKTPIEESNNLPKILIVDDNIDMIAYLQELFSNSFDCTAAFNGQEALSLIKKQTFDLIISDLRMPLANGIQLKEEVNKIPASKDIPFIMITAVYYDKLKDLKNLLGIHEYIEKPFTKDEIISRVQFVLERSLFKKELYSKETVPVTFNNSDMVLMKKIQEIVLKNITNTDFNVGMLAAASGYEPDKLNKILKEKLGLSSVQVILEFRLLKAYDLIVKNTYSTLGEVIYSVGLNSRQYFNQKFEQRFGIKPKEFQRKTKAMK